MAAPVHGEPLPLKLFGLTQKEGRPTNVSVHAVAVHHGRVKVGEGRPAEEPKRKAKAKPPATPAKSSTTTRPSKPPKPAKTSKGKGTTAKKKTSKGKSSAARKR